jgi:hypothetical protein
MLLRIHVLYQGTIQRTRTHDQLVSTRIFSNSKNAPVGMCLSEALYSDTKGNCK